jgi:hypothetical protein
MMRLHLPALLLPLALAACGDSATTVEFAKVCVKELDGKTIATTGYLHSPFTALCRAATRRGGTTTTCSYDLRDKADGEVRDGAGRLSLNIEVGSGENRVDDARLKAKEGAAAIRDSGGKLLANKAEVRVTGVLHAVPNSLKAEETICWLDVEKIARR